MNIIRLTPQGYCGGVKKALRQVFEICEHQNTPKPIYMLGSIIHNAKVIEQFKEKGILLLESNTLSKLALLETIQEGTVIFSAHGVAPAVQKRALEKGLTIVDTTCPKVAIIHQNMKKYLSLGYDCFYIGTKGHPECEAVLGIDKRIQLLKNQSDIAKINTTNPIYITNQTTLSFSDTKELYHAILKAFPNAILENTICNATTVRQEAVLNQKPVDLCLIVGDRHSSNTNKLVEAGLKASIPTQLVESLEDVQKIDFQQIHSISISSGASTPSELVEQIIAYLEEL